MLKRFEVSNYRTFEKMISIDFSNVGGYQFNQDCITDNIMSKMIVYGRNATGKTNFGNAILDIVNILVPGNIWNPYDDNFLNADSDKAYAEFKYVFQFGEDEIQYSYKKVTNEKLLDERLIINNKDSFYMEFDKQTGSVYDMNIVNVEGLVLKRYFDSLDMYEDGERVTKTSTLPFLRWLINSTPLPEDSVLLKLDDYVKRMKVIEKANPMIFVNTNFYELLDKDDNLQDFEDFLNVMGVECKLTLRTLPEGKKELYFVHNKLVPFMETASSGTLALLNLYKRLSIGKEASFLYLDEFDAFYHYEMSENVVKFFKAKYPKCQLILTTHNTNLMTNKLMRPDCLFIISRDGRLTALCDATTRELREGHNLEKLYISGEFDKFE